MEDKEVKVTLHDKCEANFVSIDGEQLLRLSDDESAVWYRYTDTGFDAVTVMEACEQYEYFYELVTGTLPDEQEAVSAFSPTRAAG